MFSLYLVTSLNVHASYQITIDDLVTKIFKFLFTKVYWSESGELMCIATEESFFVLKYSTEAVEKARENPESINEDGIEDAFDVRLF